MRLAAATRLETGDRCSILRVGNESIAMTNKDLPLIPYTKPSITELEIQFVNDAVANGWGEHCYDYIFRFEKDLKHI